MFFCIKCSHPHRSNITKVSDTIRQSFKLSKSKSIMHRSKSDVDEITTCLQLALNDTVFDHKAFHRLESGELKPRHFKHESKTPKISSMRNVRSRSTVVKGIQSCPPMEISDKTKTNLGKVSVWFECLSIYAPVYEYDVHNTHYTAEIRRFTIT